MVRLETLFRALLDAPDRGISLGERIRGQTQKKFDTILDFCVSSSQFILRFVLITYHTRRGLILKVETALQTTGELPSASRPNTRNYSPHFVWQVGGDTTKSNFLYWEKSNFLCTFQTQYVW
jgi:hypothetical protein